MFTLPGRSISLLGKVRQLSSIRQFLCALSEQKDVTALTDAEDIAPYNTDWTGNFLGSSKVVVQPKSTEGVSKVLSLCNTHSLPVIPRSGNTGLVGGSVCRDEDGIILSMEHMNKIINFDADTSIVTLEAGCILATVEEYLNKRDFTFPLDLGSSGSCFIGGNVATNAGGLRYVRYGSLKGNLLGMEAVLPDGTVLDMMSSVRKDSTGYDLKQLFVGSEGTLGVITKLAFAVFPRPAGRNVILLGLSSFDMVSECIRVAKRALGETLSAMEYWCDGAMRLTLSDAALGHSDPFNKTYPFYVLVESSGANIDHDAAKMEQFANTVMTTGIVEDGVLAQDDQQAQELFHIRETITVALKSHKDHVYKYDVSLPTVGDLDTATAYVRKHLTKKYPESQVIQFGHVGDCNLHLNALYPEYCVKVEKDIEDALYSFIAQCRGSISAEHGIGELKRGKLLFSKQPEVVSLMEVLKQQLDPKGIMNPNKLL